MPIRHQTVLFGVAKVPKPITANSWNMDHDGNNPHGHTGEDDGGYLQLGGDSGIAAHELAFVHSNIHAPGSDNQDISGKVDKVTNKSLVLDTEIAKIHSAGSDNQDLSSYVVNTDSRLSDARTPLTHSHSYEPANANIQTHVGSAHAPSNAQKNSDIIQSEIEAKLTGTITSHSHAGGADPFTKLILLANKATGANVTPITTGLTFNFEANSWYVIDIFAMVKPTAATTGCGFSLDVSVAVTYVATFVSHSLALTGTLAGASSVGDLAVTVNGVSSGHPGTQTYPVLGGGILISGASAGTATLFFRSETTAVTTLMAGTMIRIMKMG